MNFNGLVFSRSAPELRSLVPRAGFFQSLRQRSTRAFFPVETTRSFEKA